ncbi:hypothetical protein KVR01_008795 [Diaporthe batatas]|uniref:uncharacterized protein n=1 Tax=Diaporthe batatas TaxID=748121 RepID=UPI001D052093|nr:uncharacterized protein KVR01_008795 [Diaporthe batatas]KAG8161808.1 hypothetical protein KVR01_008795 [Diaporthe batatas]
MIINITTFHDELPDLLRVVCQEPTITRERSLPPSKMTIDSTTGKVLSPAALVHVVLQTSQYEPMVAFYKEFLGAHATYENEYLAFLTYDEEHHRVAIAHLPTAKPKDPTAAGLAHMAFAFKTFNDLLLAYRQRKARGILPIWSINHGPTTSIYYQDPDGNQIETQVDNFDTVEDANAFMNSPEFAENPIGVDFDPEDLIKRVENGEDVASLRKRPSIGPRGVESIPVPPRPDVRKSYDIIQT